MLANDDLQNGHGLEVVLAHLDHDCPVLDAELPAVSPHQRLDRVLPFLAPSPKFQNSGFLSHSGNQLHAEREVKLERERMQQLSVKVDVKMGAEGN